MGLVRSTQPAEEPLTLAEAKLHCRVDTDFTADDALLTALIVAARALAETRCNRTIAKARWQLTLDRFPEAIRLPMPRVTQVLSVHYRDPDGVLCELDAADVTLDNASQVANWLYPAADASWPDTWCQPNGVVVVYEAGWSRADVPQEIKQWLLMAVATGYRNREAVVADRDARLELPRTYVDGLLDAWTVPQVA